MSLNIDQTKLEAICQKYGVDFLGVFGSTARREDRADSDLDLLVRFAPDSKIGYFKLFDIENQLKESFGISKPVDIITQDALNPRIKDRVYSDLKTIYGQP